MKHLDLIRYLKPAIAIQDTSYHHGPPESRGYICTQLTQGSRLKICSSPNPSIFYSGTSRSPVLPCPWKSGTTHDPIGHIPVQIDVFQIWRTLFTAREVNAVGIYRYTTGIPSYCDMPKSHIVLGLCKITNSLYQLPPPSSPSNTIIWLPFYQCNGSSCFCSNLVLREALKPFSLPFGMIN